MDLIERQAAIDAVESAKTARAPDGEIYVAKLNAEMNIQILPSAQSEVDLRKIGEFDMFNLISSAWYGKQCYFKQDNEMVYSRISGKYMKVDDALREFLGEINDG